MGSMATFRTIVVCIYIYSIYICVCVCVCVLCVCVCVSIRRNSWIYKSLKVFIIVTHYLTHF